MIAERIVDFARTLRAAGLRIGSDRVLNGIAAVEAVGMTRRADVHAALSLALLDRREQQELFDAAFESYWHRQASPTRSGLKQNDGFGIGANRLGNALLPTRAMQTERLHIEADLRASDAELLRRADFAAMSADEFRIAQSIARELAVPLPRIRLRRHAAAGRGRIDLRRTLQRMVRAPQTLAPAFTRPREATPPIVVLLDISGSMDRYARVFLHYVHALAQRLPRVHVMTFGSRLTDITRCLRHRDPDVALQLVDARVPDWGGGTRMGSALAAFNRNHARRVLGGRASMLLVTDGLDRDAAGGLSDAAARLRRMAHRVVWLNPLLRFDGFEPKASGVRALLPHVDRMIPVHNLESLADLARMLRSVDR